MIRYDSDDGKLVARDADAVANAESQQEHEFLFAGYVVVWLLIVGYLYSINRRQKRLDREIALLKQMHEEK